VLENTLRSLRRRTWFRRQGALVQKLVVPRGYDLQVLVAGGEVVGSAARLAAPGEWRTNVALGGRRLPAPLPARARELTLAAADALGADLVGVDLLPLPGGGWTVLELNGAVDFTAEYSVPGRDVFDEVARVLAVPAPAVVLAGAAR
jgi:glutathione synthase/RimK-type ligase-like ATP-grasp enzyme